MNVQAAADEVDGRRDDADVGLDPAQDDRVDLGGQRLLNDNNIIILASDIIFFLIRIQSYKTQSTVKLQKK